jgi:hypothetical protein
LALDPGSGIGNNSDPGLEKIRTRDNIPNPQHCKIQKKFGFQIIPEDHIIRNGEDGSDPRANTCNSEKAV